MTTWGDYIVVVRSYDVQFFTRPSSSPPRLLTTFEFGRFIWEVVIIHGSARALIDACSNGYINHYHKSPGGGLPDTAPFDKMYASWDTIAKTGVQIPTHRSNDWANLDYRHKLRRQGTPSDRAWLFEHAFHFLGQPESILYRDPNNGDEVLFRTGGLHFLLGDDGEDVIYVYGAELTLSDILGNGSMMWPEKVRDINWTVDREWEQFELLLRGG